MNPEPAPASRTAPQRWCASLHDRLLPDYNRKAVAFWWLAVGLGAVALCHSLRSLLGASPEQWLHLLLGTAMAVVAALVPVRVPRSTHSFTAGETFLFLLLLVNGPEAATLAAACEALTGSWRTSRRWSSRIASPALAAIAMFGAGTLLERSFQWLKAMGWLSDTAVLVGVLLFSGVYFVLNTLLVTTLPRLKRDEPLRLLPLFGSLGLIGVAYAGNASLAGFLYLGLRQSGPVIVISALPIIAILLTTGHYFFRREEAEESVRKARAAEAEQAVRHVRELQVSERRFHSAFTHASIGMALVSFDGKIRQANRALHTLFGWPEGDEESNSLRFSEFVQADGVTSLHDELARFRNGSLIEGLALELRCQHRAGHEVWVEVHCSIFSEVGSPEQSLILQVQDITARHKAEAELQYIAFHDDLTGLPNRQRFRECLVRAIARAKASPAHRFGVMFLDFDRFKLINDSLGHLAGDEFLIQVSRRLGENVRPGDVVARLGGDEFAILTEGGGDQRFVTSLADRLLDVLKRPMLLCGTEISTSASIGITFGDTGYTEAESVLRDADIAMYKAKAAGKARYALFDASLHTEVSNRLRLEGDLRKALAEGQMSVHYQPLYTLASNQLIGFEALARWVHPELGPISPGQFIPVAEESGSIQQITEFVLNTACRELKRWQQRSPVFADLIMHVNVAGQDLSNSNFVPRVSHALLSARLQPQHLAIELTENILMERLEEAIGMLNELHDLGIGLSVDDFGTGYSSLSHLSTLPIDSLKIDMSFVRNLRVDSKEAAVIRAIVLLGKSLGKEVIAEGIETDSQRDQLRELGCDVGQGYLLSRPLPSEGIDTLLERLSPTRARVASAKSDAAVSLFH